VAQLNCSFEKVAAEVAVTERSSVVGSPLAGLIRLMAVVADSKHLLPIPGCRTTEGAQLPTEFAETRWLIANGVEKYSFNASCVLFIHKK
jgi:hypothetical protein